MNDYNFSWTLSSPQAKAEMPQGLVLLEIRPAGRGCVTS